MSSLFRIDSENFRRACPGPGLQLAATIANVFYRASVRARPGGASDLGCHQLSEFVVANQDSSFANATECT